MTSDMPYFIYPDDDLLDTPVATFFDRVNFCLPLLHRPTFERSIANNLHLQDQGFGATLLLVCAVGSRYVSDPRATLHGDSSRLSSGWAYFAQVPIVRKYNLNKATVYDIQYYCVCVRFTPWSVDIESLGLASDDLFARNISPQCVVDFSRFRYSVCSGARDASA
jgi:hypothetical protein